MGKQLLGSRGMIDRSKPKNMCQNSLSSKKEYGYSCTQITYYRTGVYKNKSKLREKSSDFSYHEITLNFSLKFSRSQSHVGYSELLDSKILCEIVKHSAMLRSFD